MEENFTNIKKFIWNQFDKTNLDLLKYIFDEDDYYKDEFDSNLNRAIDDMDDCEWGKYGASKLVLAFYTLKDWVIKIPFKGEVFYDIDIEDYNTENFYGASDDNNNEWDYCETEARLYQYAKMYGVEDFFAPTFYLGSYKNYPIYISKKIDGPTFADANEKQKNTPLKKEDWEDFSFHCHVDINNEILKIMIFQHGIQHVLRFINFIHTFNISDFNYENIMFDSNNKIFIVDYSGYHE